MASYLHRTAQPSTLAIFRSWGNSTGAGRIRLAGAKIGEKFLVYCLLFVVFENNYKQQTINNKPFSKTKTPAYPTSNQL